MLQRPSILSARIFFCTNSDPINLATCRAYLSDLSDRKQQLYVSGKLFCERDIQAGVPQGSVLGPLILFINDLPLHIEFRELDLYADDTTISASSSSLSTLLNFITAVVSNFFNWCIKILRII